MLKNRQNFFHLRAAGIYNMGAGPFALQGTGSITMHELLATVLSINCRRCIILHVTAPLMTANFVFNIYNNIFIPYIILRSCRADR